MRDNDDNVKHREPASAGRRSDRAVSRWIRNLCVDALAHQSAEMGTNCCVPGGCDYFSLFESEARLIASVSAEWGTLETGGDLYGLLTHAGRVIVFLATPPGPNAIHDATHFQQDIDYFHDTAQRVRERFGLHVVGGWHSHHILGLPEPSRGDVQQVQSITVKNGITSWVEIIITFESSTSAGDRSSRRVSKRLRRGQSTYTGAEPIVQANSFAYGQVTGGQPVRCRTKLIRGLSPMRQALLGSEPLASYELGFPGWVFPLERISFDSVDPPRPQDGAAQTLPAHVLTQVESLPNHVQAALTVTSKGGLIVFTLPFLDGSSAWVAFEGQDASSVRALHMVGPDSSESRDVMEEAAAAGALDNMGSIYSWLAERLSTDVRTAVPSRATTAPGRLQQSTLGSVEDVTP